MPKGVRRAWPDDDALVELLTQHAGNVAAAAEALAVQHATLTCHIKARGLKPKLEELRAAGREQATRDALDAARRKTEIRGDTATVYVDPVDLGDIEGLLRSRNLDPDEWVVTSATLNEWDGPVAGGGTQVLRQLKVTLKRAPRLILAAPAVHVPPVRPRPGTRRSRRADQPRVTVVEGDHQAPYHDPDLDVAACKLIADVGPAEHVLLGDTMDLPTISKHADHPAAQAKVQECIQAGYELVRRRRDAHPDARCRKLKGNHDWRLESELLVRAERLYGIKPADTGDGPEVDALSLRRLLHLDALGVELVEDPRGWEHAEVELVPGPQGLVVRHGWLTGENSAKRSVHKRGRSMIVGHGHAREHWFGWDPSAECERQAVMAGTMSLARDHRFPHFAVADLWLQGLVVVTVWPDGEFQVEHARWDGKRLRWRDRSY